MALLQAVKLFDMSDSSVWIGFRICDLGVQRHLWDAYQRCTNGLGTSHPGMVFPKLAWPPRALGTQSIVHVLHAAKSPHNSCCQTQLARTASEREGRITPVGFVLIVGHVRRIDDR